MPVITNTTVISNFAAVERLDLLHRRFKTLYVSDHVFEEIQNGLTQGYMFYEHFAQHVFPFSKIGGQRNISISGTLGILLSLVHQNHMSLPEADSVLSRMMQFGYYSPATSLKEILDEP